MRAAKFQVWTWFEACKRKPIYVGWGAYRKTHPAIEMYRAPLNSELGTWLKLCEKEPYREDYSGSLLHKDEARALCQLLRSRYEAGGVYLLSNREFDTYAGGGAPKAVRSPSGEIFDSVRAAADAKRKNPSTVTRWCGNPETGWAYV